MSFALIVGGSQTPIAKKLPDETSAMKFVRQIFDEMSQSEADGWTVTYNRSDKIVYALQLADCPVPRVKISALGFDALWECSKPHILDGSYLITPDDFTTLNSLFSKYKFASIS